MTIPVAAVRCGNTAVPTFRDSSCALSADLAGTIHRKFNWSGAMALRWTGLASLTRRASPNYWDVIAFAMIVAVFVAIANGSRGMVAELPAAGSDTVSLDYGNLPYYALRTVLRMFIALGFSFLFTFTYATLAARADGLRWCSSPS